MGVVYGRQCSTLRPVRVERLLGSATKGYSMNSILALPFSSPFMFLIVVVALLILAVAWRRGTLATPGPALVLREWLCTEYPADDIYVRIVGREAGLVSYVLTAMGVEAESRLLVDGKCVAFETRGVFGYVRHVVPTTSVASAHAGYFRPVLYLFVAGIAGLLALDGALQRQLEGAALYVFILMLLAAGLVLAYALSKKVAIALESFGGQKLGLTFKPSVIEGVRVGLPETLRALGIIEGLVTEAQRHSLRGFVAPPPVGPVESAKPPSTPTAPPAMGLASSLNRDERNEEPAEQVTARSVRADGPAPRMSRSADFQLKLSPGEEQPLRFAGVVWPVWALALGGLAIAVLLLLL
jgi:hypothetical protein